MGWSTLAQSVVKPRNDSFAVAAGTVWRANEDRYQVRAGRNGVVAAVADGAGASGLFCGAWAEALVRCLPDAPLVDLAGLDAWLAGFTLDFRNEFAGHLAGQRAKHGKFVREGSCAALAACWLLEGDGGVSVGWLGYGDCPVLVFDRTGIRPKLLVSHPDTMADLGRDPHLLNWKDLPVANGLRTGRVELPPRASVVLASDGIGQYLLLRHLAAAPARRRPRLARDLRCLAKSDDGGRVARLAQAHLAAPRIDALAELRDHLTAEAAFAALVRRLHDDRLLVNDDATLVLIDVDREDAI